MTAAKATPVLPLAGKTIVLTREPEQAAESRQLLESYGAHVVLFPTIGFTALTLDEGIMEQLLNGGFTYVIFPSQNAVEYFARGIKRQIPINHLCTVVAVGSKTEERMHHYGFRADIVPGTHNAAGVIEVLANKAEKGNTVLILSSDISREELPDGLRKLGLSVTQAPVYVTGLPTLFTQYESNKRLRESVPDAFMFSSPSTFKNFLLIADVFTPDYFSGKQVVGIGPTTVQEITAFGVLDVLQPPKASFAAMVDVLAEFYKKEKK